jgi:hypothetical protein
VIGFNSSYDTKGFFAHLLGAAVVFHRACTEAAAGAKRADVAEGANAAREIAVGAVRALMQARTAREERTAKRDMAADAC